MRKLLFLIAGLAWLTTGIAQQPAPAAPTTAENSLLWEISGKELKQSSFLYGTIHMIAKKDYILTDQTREAFNRAKRVTFEINLEEMNNIAVMMPLMMKALMKGDTTLRDLLTEEDYAIVNTHFEKMGLPMFVLERIKPMFLSAMGSEDMMQMQQEPGQVVSYEMEFMEMARKQGKQIAGLETAEYQMSVFDSIPYKAQAEMLVQTVKSGDSGSEQFEQLVELYKKQDLQGLQGMLSADESGIAPYEDLLLGRRNRNWIPVMERMMGEQTTFFAVGAGHLAGTNGVIALLRQQGYTVRPLK